MLIYYLVKKNQTHVTFRKLTQLEYIVLTKKKNPIKNAHVFYYTSRNWLEKQEDVKVGDCLGKGKSPA